MEGSGRKSTASLTVVPAGIPARMEPPQELTEAQSELWRGIVLGKPVEWFSVDNAPLLTEYVRAVDAANKLSGLIDRLLTSAEDYAGAALAKDLLNMRDKEAKRATSIATKLRLTQQSRYTPQAAATADKRASGARPWSN